MNTDEQRIRERLDGMLDEVLRRTGAVEKHLRGRDGRHEADFEDRVSYIEMDEVLEQLDDSGRAEIDRIKGAIERLRAGTYGTCVRCGDAIDPRRLVAIPATPFCTSCAEEVQA